MATIPDGAIDIAIVEAEIDAIQADVLALLARGRNLLEDRQAALTAGMRDAGLILAYRPYLPAVADPDTGAIVTPMQEAGLYPVEDERWEKINARLDMIQAVAQILTAPVGGDQPSLAQQIRAGGRRFRAQP